MKPGQVLSLLNEIFTAFDELVEEAGLDKIKTIDDAYMVAAGVPTPRADHALAICDLALAIRNRTASLAPLGRRLALRMGIASGPVVAGIIGRRKFSYDLWGDTVNTASRMESLAVAGQIEVTRRTHALVGHAFECGLRGIIHVKGKGPMEAWWTGPPTNRGEKRREPRGERPRSYLGAEHHAGGAKLVDVDLPPDTAPSLRTPHPGPRSREILARLASTEARSALTFGLGDHPPVLSRGRGAVIEDPDGNLFLDMVAGFGSLNLGHSHPRVVEAAARQLSLGQQAMSIAAEVRVQLLERLTALLPAGYRTILGASGSEAMETALKLVRRATGKPGVVAFAGGFHGRTLGALGLMGRESQRRGLGQLGPRVEHVPYPDPERSPFGAGPERVTAGVLDYLDSQLGDPAGGWDDIGAVVVEPVQGNGGMIPAPSGFLEGLQEVCDRHDVVLVVDEVMSGFCRTGRLFAYQLENVSPDVVVVGKSLSAGLPLSGCLVSEKVEVGSSPNTESSTYAGNLVSCAAALAALDVYEEDQMAARAGSLGEHLTGRLRAELTGMPSVDAIRGRGLMVGVRLIDEDGAPLPAARQVTDRAIREGLLLYAAGHFTDVVAFLPPLVASHEQLDTAVGILAGILNDL